MPPEAKSLNGHIEKLEASLKQFAGYFEKYPRMSQHVFYRVFEGGGIR